MRTWSLARQLLALQVGVVLVVVVVVGLLAYVDADRDVTDAAARRTEAVATTVADAADVRTALDDAEPSVRIQPYAEQVRHDAGVSFITVMSPTGIRYSHPNPALIGQSFVGNIGPAQRGTTFSETYTGTLGPSLRTVVPVLEDGRVVALVAVGISVGDIGADLRRQLPALLLALAGVLALAVTGFAMISRRLLRVTGGLGPEELRRMHDYYDAVLHSVREGLLLVDDAGRVQVANDEAVRLLDLPADVVGRSLADLGLSGDLVGAVLDPTGTADQLVVTAERVVAVSAAGVTAAVGRDTGRVVTLRDRTDLQELTGELDATRGLAAALSSQAHESANRLHTVIALVELGRPEDAVSFAVEELRLAQGLTDKVLSAVEEPVLAALLLGKAAVAAERGVVLTLDTGTVLDAGRLDVAGLPARDLVTVLGNLIDNAFDAVMNSAVRRVAVKVDTSGQSLLIQVADTGAGLDPEVAQHAFERGWTTKARGPDRLHGRGLGLALVGQTVSRLGGDVMVERAATGSDDDDDRGGAVFTVRIPLRSGRVESLR